MFLHHLDPIVEGGVRAAVCVEASRFQDERAVAVLDGVALVTLELIPDGLRGHGVT